MRAVCIRGHEFPITEEENTELMALASRGGSVNCRFVLYPARPAVPGPLGRFCGASASVRPDLPEEPEH